MLNIKKRKGSTDSLVKEKQLLVHQDLPNCNIPVNYDIAMKECRYTEDLPIEEILLGHVQSDCLGIEVKYTCYEQPIVERNHYVIDSENDFYCHNTKHPDYIQSISKLKGDQFRTYCANNPKEFMESIDYVNLYVWGNSPNMMKLTKLQNGTFKKEFFGSDEYIKEYPEHAK